MAKSIFGYWLKFTDINVLTLYDVSRKGKKKSYRCGASYYTLIKDNKEKLFFFIAESCTIRALMCIKK